MKKTCIAIVLLLVMLCSTASADLFFITQARVEETLVTRTGPGTEYTGGGTFNMTGQKLTVMTYNYDNGGLCWVMVEIPTNDGYRYLYTNSSRFRKSDFEEFNFIEYGPSPSGTVTAIADCSVYYAPGPYGERYDDLWLSKGTRVSFVMKHQNYTMIEATYNGQKIRCWVESRYLN